MSTIAPPRPPELRSSEFPPADPRTTVQPKYPKPSRLVWTLGANVVGLILFIGGSAYNQLQIRESELFRSAVRQATNDQRVIARFGTPISVGWFLQGNKWWKTSGIGIPIRGPRSSGWIYATSSSNDMANPHFIRLEVLQQDEDFLINLLSAGPSVDANNLTKFGQVYVVPLSEKARQLAENLPAYYKAKLNLDVNVLPTLQPPEALEDSKRNQLIAEGLVDFIREKYPEQSDDPDNVLIGITDKDVYVRDFNWSFTFNYRHQQRFGIISLARLDPTFFNHWPDPEILSNRLRKVTTKLLGLMYYRLQAGPLPFSVLGSQADLWEIDRAGEDILASDVPESEHGDPCLAFTFDAKQNYRPTRLVNSCSDPHFRETPRGVVQLDLRLGLLEVRTDDFLLAGAPRILLSRVYRNQDPYHHAFGIGTNHPYDDFLYSRDKMASVVINNEAGSAARFDRTTAGLGFNPDVQFVNRGNGGEFSDGQMFWKDSHFHVSVPTGGTYSFQQCGDVGVPCYMSGYRGPAGDELQFRRQPNGELSKIETAPDASVTLPKTALYFIYNEEHSITEIRANNGEGVKYAYDDRQRLVSAQTDSGSVIRYGYDDGNNLTDLSDGTGRTILRARSDSKDRIEHLGLWDASYNISYVLDERGNIVEADLGVSDGSTIKVYMLNEHYSLARVEPPPRQ